MPLGMAGGTIFAMVCMLICSIIVALYVICKECHDSNGKLMWIFGTMAIEILVIFVTMTNYINHGIPAA
jgi:hypothetical protein